MTRHGKGLRHNKSPMLSIEGGTSLSPSEGRVFPGAVTPFVPQGRATRSAKGLL